MKGVPAAPSSPHDADRRRRLEAPAAAAPAQLGGTDDRDVPDLARDPGAAAIDRGADDDARTDAVGRLDVPDVIQPANRPEPVLADRAHVRVECRPFTPSNGRIEQFHDP
jgi:hypothetical protein